MVHSGGKTDYCKQVISITRNKFTRVPFLLSDKQTKWKFVSSTIFGRIDLQTDDLRRNSSEVRVDKSFVLRLFTSHCKLLSDCFKFHNTKCRKQSLNKTDIKILLVVAQFLWFLKFIFSRFHNSLCYYLRLLFTSLAFRYAKIF